MLGLWHPDDTGLGANLVRGGDNQLANASAVAAAGGCAHPWDHVSEVAEGNA